MHTIFLPKVKGALVLPVEQTTWVGKMVICPVDSTITEQRISHLSAYSRSGTQLYSSDHAASSAVELLMFYWVQFVPVYFRLLIRPPFLPAHFFTK